MTYYDNLFLLIFFISEPAGSKDSHIDFTLLIYYNAITPHFIARKHRNLPPYTSSVYVVVPTQFQQLSPLQAKPSLRVEYRPYPVPRMQHLICILAYETTKFLTAFLHSATCLSLIAHTLFLPFNIKYISHIPPCA